MEPRGKRRTVESSEFLPVALTIVGRQRRQESGRTKWIVVRGP